MNDKNNRLSLIDEFGHETSATVLGGELTGPEIERQVRLGTIRIDPFKPENVSTSSYDVTLGEWVTEYTGDVLDPRKENATGKYRLTSAGRMLRPGNGYLMHVNERVWSDRFKPYVDGKSSIGRLFLACHVTAGAGDPGFDGQFTLEVVPLVKPVIVYPGMKIAQIKFVTLVGEVRLYDGNYQGVDAEGPVASKSRFQR